MEVLLPLAQAPQDIEGRYGEEEFRKMEQEMAEARAETDVKKGLREKLEG